MKTSIVQALLDSGDGREADRILRACTHCGFCNAACPTYPLLGDERDGPRGRIYLIKQVLEGHEPTRKTQTHLDRCLTCRACETACPADVEYGRLADIGRELVDRRVRRPASERLLRWALRTFVPYPRRFAFLLGLGRLCRPLLPAGLKARVPAKRPTGAWPDARGAERRMLVLDGCVQPAAAPATNAAAARVLARLGIRLVRVPEAGCCGALPRHLSARDKALALARRNIEAWWPHIEAGAEAVVVTASGCGAEVAEYGYLLREDPAYADKAARVSGLVRDLSDVLANENLALFSGRGGGRRVAYQAPCTLQNAPGLHDRVAQVLAAAGYRLVPVAGSKTCCGSAGAYSILQPKLAARLRRDKLRSLLAGAPEAIVTANVGCQLHLSASAPVPVRHWIELLEE